MIKIKHLQIKELDYNYITDGIYIGTNQCCQFHFDDKLKKKGITVDISLEEERIDVPLGVEVYIWIPVKDKTPPSEDQLRFGVSAIKELVAMKKKIYVHCKNGHGRSPTLVAAYLIEKGRTPREAVDFIKKKRPTIHLEECQMNALIKFVKTTSYGK